MVLIFPLAQSKSQKSHGGDFTQNLVAEFKNDQWTQLDDLNKGRYYHGSITVGTQTMIVGGYSHK